MCQSQSPTQTQNFENYEEDRYCVQPNRIDLGFLKRFGIENAICIRQYLDKYKYVSYIRDIIGKEDVIYQTHWGKVCPVKMRYNIDHEMKYIEIVTVVYN
jgi:hypothetical protein